MKKKIDMKCYIALVSLCLLCIICLAGCFGSPGETSTEVNRRHERVIRNNALQIRDDADAFLLLDKPSKLSDKVVR